MTVASKGEHLAIVFLSHVPPNKVLAIYVQICKACLPSLDPSMIERSIADPLSVSAIMCCRGEPIGGATFQIVSVCTAQKHMLILEVMLTAVAHPMCGCGRAIINCAKDALRTCLTEVQMSDGCILVQADNWEKPFQASV